MAQSVLDYFIQQVTYSPEALAIVSWMTPVTNCADTCNSKASAPVTACRS